MRYLMSLAFVAGLLTAETASAQAPSVAGPWSLNIPQISGLPGTPIWFLTDAPTGFDGSWVLTYQQVIEVDGTMTGRQIYGPIYVADASFTAKVLVPGLPVPIPALPTVKALVFVNGNTMTGLALQSLNGAPLSVVQVHGTRLVP